LTNLPNLQWFPSSYFHADWRAIKLLADFFNGIGLFYYDILLCYAIFVYIICLSISSCNPENQSVVIDTNRCKPSKCMWIVKKDDVRPDIKVIFPFAELFRAVCHILVGVSDTHICYIHLAPLTSFMRHDTTELVKILSNLQSVTPKSRKWSFKVYYFEDNGREKKFRDVIVKSLGGFPVEFTSLTPKGYVSGALNLVLTGEEFSYSLKNLQMLALQDVSVRVCLTNFLLKQLNRLLKKECLLSETAYPAIVFAVVYPLVLFNIILK